MGIDFPLKEKSRFSGMLRLEKIMMSVLSGLNDIALYPDLNNVSSANSLLSETSVLAISFI